MIAENYYAVKSDFIMALRIFTVRD